MKDSQTSEQINLLAQKFPGLSFVPSLSDLACDQRIVGVMHSGFANYLLESDEISQCLSTTSFIIWESPDVPLSPIWKSSGVCWFSLDEL